MRTRKALQRTALAATAFVFVACQDNAPSGPSPTASGSLSITSLRPLQASARFNRVAAEVLALPGTVFADDDETINKLVFGVEGPGAIGQVRATAARLGLTDGEYDVEITSPAVQAATLRDVFRPTQGGIQIHFSRYLCTLGFNVDHAGGRSFVTNSHCTKKQGGTEGTTYFQPASNVDGTVIATEAADPAYFSGGVCPKGKLCRYSDASRAAYSAGTASNRGEIARTTGANNGSVDVAGVFNVLGQDNVTTSFEIGTVVGKVGRTSGWTEGPVTRTCVHTGVQGSRIVQLCQTWVAAGVGGGDSGAPVFASLDGSNVVLVGILWGGSADGATYIFSPLKQIQDELGAVNATK